MMACCGGVRSWCLSSFASRPTATGKKLMQLLQEKELDVLFDADWNNSTQSLGMRDFWTVEAVENQNMMRKVSEQAEKDLIDLDNHNQREMAKDYRDYEII